MFGRANAPNRRHLERSEGQRSCCRFRWIRNLNSHDLSDGWYEDEREAEKKFKGIVPRYARGDANVEERES